MVQLPQLCADLELDESAVRRALQAESRLATHGMPWIAQIFLGLGAWVIAILIVAFAAVFLDLVLGFDSLKEHVPQVLLGVVIFGHGLFLTTGSAINVFKTQFAVAAAAAGMGMMSVGADLEADSVWVGAIVATALAALVASKGHSRLLQFLSSAFAAGYLGLALLIEETPYILDIISLAALFGVFLFLCPPVIDLHPTAMVLLLVMPILAVFVDVAAELGRPAVVGGWLARTFHIALFLWLAVTLWRREEMRHALLELGAFAGAAAAVSILLPPGGSAALLLMMLAFVLGSRRLAVLGVVLQTYFVFRFYYDLNLTLLTKSLILMSVGVIALALWRLVAWRQTASGTTESRA